MSELHENIEKYLNLFVENHVGKDFKFRPGQKEAIIDIVITYFDEKKKIYLL